MADRALADAGDEILDHRQRDVGLEQRDPDVAQRRLDVGLAQGAAALEAVEHGAETTGQTFEHQRASRNGLQTAEMWPAAGAKSS